MELRPCGWSVCSLSIQAFSFRRLLVVFDTLSSAVKEKLRNWQCPLKCSVTDVGLRLVMLCMCSEIRRLSSRDVSPM